MAITDDQKLDNFDAETMGEAEEIKKSILSQTEEEKKAKLRDGEDEIIRELQIETQNQTESLRKENDLKVSRHMIKLRQEYLKLRDEILTKVNGEVKKKIIEFTSGGGYTDYLYELTVRAVSVTGAECDVYYGTADFLRAEEVKTRLINEKPFDYAELNFIEDKTIKFGGFKFHERKRGILLNETLDVNLERSHETLNVIMGPYFRI